MVNVLNADMMRNARIDAPVTLGGLPVFAQQVLAPVTKIAPAPVEVVREPLLPIGPVIAPSVAAGTTAGDLPPVVNATAPAPAVSQDIFPVNVAPEQPSYIDVRQNITDTAASVAPPSVSALPLGLSQPAAGFGVVSATGGASVITSSVDPALLILGAAALFLITRGAF